MTTKIENKKGYTLVEILIVISIIGFVASAAMYFLNSAREKGRIAGVISFSESIRSSLADDIIGWWKFDEGSGSTSADIWGGNDVDLSGSWEPNGVVGSAYRFIGTGWVATNFARNIGEGFSYSFFFRLPDTSDLDGGFLCTDMNPLDGTYGDNPGQDSTNGYGLNTCSGAGGDMFAPDLNVSDIKWHHYAVSKGTESKVCLDGKCVTFGDTTGSTFDMGHIEFNGGCGCGYGNFDQGIIIDELIIYSRAF